MFTIIRLTITNNSHFLFWMYLQLRRLNFLHFSLGPIYLLLTSHGFVFKKKQKDGDAVT